MPSHLYKTGSALQVCVKWTWSRTFIWCPPKPRDTGYLACSYSPGERNSEWCWMKDGMMPPKWQCLGMVKLLRVLQIFLELFFYWSLSTFWSFFKEDGGCCLLHQHFGNGTFEVFIPWETGFECRILGWQFFFPFDKLKVSIYSTLASLFVLGDLDVSIGVSQFYIPNLYLSVFLFVSVLLLLSILVKVS